MDQSGDKEVDQLDNDTSVIEPSAVILSYGQVEDINFSHMLIVTVNKEGWPERLRDWFGVFTDKNFGLLWISLVVKWMEIEHSYKLVRVGHCFAWQVTHPSRLVTSYLCRPLPHIRKSVQCWYDWCEV